MVIQFHLSRVRFTHHAEADRFIMVHEMHPTLSEQAISMLHVSELDIQINFGSKTSS